MIGGLAAGPLIGAATSAYAAPTHGYGYGASPVYGTRRVVRHYDHGYDYVPTYRTRRVVQHYNHGYAPVRYGYSWSSPSYYHDW